MTWKFLVLWSMNNKFKRRNLRRDLGVNKSVLLIWLAVFWISFQIWIDLLHFYYAFIDCRIRVVKFLVPEWAYPRVEGEKSMSKDWFISCLQRRYLLRIDDRPKFILQLRSINSQSQFIELNVSWSESVREFLFRKNFNVAFIQILLLFPRENNYRM